MNQEKEWMKVALKDVLIDTWWNVNNVINKSFSVITTGFNRYMVECESLLTVVCQMFETRFNRYMVECEYCYRINVDTTVIGFNRYMVECEFYQTL